MAEDGAGPGGGWGRRRVRKAARLARVEAWTDGKVLDPARVVEALECLLAPGDRVVVEGDNQKQADFLSRALAAVDPASVHGLHLVQSALARPEHLDLFERGIATVVDFCFAGPQSERVADLLAQGRLRVGGIHTYLELYARMLVDLPPDAALVAAVSADRAGNLYTGPNTEDTPAIVEAAAFRDGVVVAQVNELVDDGAGLPRVDIPGDWVDLVVLADRPFHAEPLFTRDPAKITEMHVLMAMLAIRGVYERHEVVTLNHGIGYDTAAIELLLPTYAERLGLKGRIARRFVLNPHPTLIPAIESGWVESVTSPGSENGMERYVAARPDVFALGRDGSLRSSRLMAQIAGLYGVDMFIGSTLQVDAEANSSTVTDGRLTGFGGAPNLGSDARGRRHPTPTWLSLATAEGTLGVARGRKLVVQIASTVGATGAGKFVERLDAVAVGEKAGMPLAPVMIYGDDVTHVVSERGVSSLYRARDLAERREAVAAVAGRSTPAVEDRLRRDGLFAGPADLGVNVADADRSLLAARCMDDLVTWSGGLYDPPPQFRVPGQR